MSDLKPQPRCTVCHYLKKPIGRDAHPAAGPYCDHECEGYMLDQLPGYLWPSEYANEPKEDV